MQQKHGRDGLIIVTVDMDEPTAEARKKANDFLQQVKAQLVNVAIADGEKPDDWFKKWNTEAVPFGLVYDRQGKLAKKFEGGDFEPADIERFVLDLLKK
jgi:hypothetical protein